jgi:hypothetical protein
MNKELKDRVFDVPKYILDSINKTFINLKGMNVDGVKRAERLLGDRKVNYKQLKRIIHDLENIDKLKDNIRYRLYGGDNLLIWGKQLLKGERDLIKNRKESKKRADEMSGLSGDRKNSFLKKHRKKSNFKIPTNLIKSNSHKTSVSPITSLKLFEEIKRIKKLMI